MHRVVIGYEGPLDIDHINHNALDNRRCNLRITTRSENVLNRRDIEAQCSCRECGKEWVQVIKAGSRIPVYCCTQCATKKYKRARILASAMRMPIKRQCQWCNEDFDVAATHQKYCTESCRKSAKWRRQTESGNKPPSATNAASYLRKRRKLISAGLL